MAISIDDVKALRGRTQAGVIDCRNALAEAGGDMEKAVSILRDKGLATATKRADRETNQGLVEAYIHGGRIGAMVEVNCETRLRRAHRTLPDARPRPRHAGRLHGARRHSSPRPPRGRRRPPEQLALLAQPFIKDQSKSVQDLVNETVASTGEKIEVHRMVRYTLGE